ncbi:O-antigen ligase family protein [Desulfobulbus rhabdoformis]|uniref:O-antigen ligase family protein n=1 Tax=Desulfobulbus rhabdoformis TaxID=34032 RepID=UPI00196603BB|nr:O-antigen ligase family protein [Desulfobulbus rhabdoformis]MBM9612680.1 O-antigen ligase family protein [Desulfobulbus rhabdoformis]
MLVGLGSWLIYSQPKLTARLISSRWLLPAALLIFWMAMQSLPLPLSWLQWLSPARGERVEMLNLLAGLQHHFAPLSDQGAASLQQVIMYLGLVIYFISLRILFRIRHSFIHTIAVVIVLVGTFEALYGLFQFLLPQVGILWLQNHTRAAQGTIIYKNQYAALLNMCWPVAVALALTPFGKMPNPSTSRTVRQRIRRILNNLNRETRLALLYLFAAGIMLLAVLFSLSRGGILTMLFILFSLNFILPLSRTTKLIFSCGLLVILGGYSTLLGLETIINRFGSIDQSGLTRLELYQSSLPMLKEHWLTGIGLGSYDLLSPVYLKGFSSTIHFSHAHNEYLEFVLELGVPAALLLFGWLGTLLLVSGKKLSMGSKTVSHFDFEVLLGGVAFSGLLGFFIHGWVDFGWQLPANLVYAVTLAAFLATSLDVLRPRKRSKMKSRESK